MPNYNFPETEEELNLILSDMHRDGAPKESMKWLVDEFDREQAPKQMKIEQTEEKGFFQQAKEAVGETIGRIKEGTGEAFQKGVDLERAGREYQQEAKTEFGKAVGEVDRIAGGARAGLAPLEGILKESARGWGELGKLLMSTDVGEDVKAKFNEIVSRPDVQNIIKTYSPEGEVPVATAVQKGVEFAQETPGVRGLTSLAGSTAMLEGATVGGKILKEGVESGVKGVKEGLETASEKYAQRQLENLGQKAVSEIDETITKAVKPRKQMNSEAERKAYTQKARQAVNSIVDNKQNLRLTDEAGDIVEGKLPESVQQFSESVEQTKKNIFKQYDDLAKQTGNTGAVISLDPISNELTSLLDNIVIQDLSPETANYIQKMVERFSTRGTYTPSQAQEIIQGLNEELKSFYRNPSYGSASKVTVDAMIANKLRQQLDEAIETATGEQYQELKNQYGALKQIERDVTRAAQRVANKNQAGLVDAISGLATASQVAQFLTTGGLSNLAQGAATEGIRKWWNMVNSPDRAVRKMFETVDNYKSQSQKVLNQKTKKSEPISTTVNNTGKVNIEKTTPDKSKSKVYNQKGFIGKDDKSVFTEKALIEEAKKYKSAEEFVTANKFIEAPKLNWETIPEDGVKAEIPLNKLRVGSKALDIATRNVKRGDSSRTAGDIDVVMLKDGTFAIYEGHHRAAQKVLQKDKNIRATVYSSKDFFDSQVKDFENLDTVFSKEETLTKQQLTDIWNKANK